MSRARKSNPVFESIPQASGATGIPVAVFKAAKNDGCPAFITGNRIDLFEFLKWFFNRDDKASTVPEGYASWSEFLKQEQALREQNKRLKEEEKLIEKAEVKRQSADAEAYYFSELDRMERELPQILEGKPALDIKENIEKFNKQLRTNAREKFQKVGEKE